MSRDCNTLIRFATVCYLSLLLSASNVSAPAVSTSVTVQNAAPTVGALTFSDDIAITGGSTELVWCNATVSDANGYQDISSVRAELYISPGTLGGTNNYTIHYSNSSCSLSSGSGLTKSAYCSFTLQFNTNAGEWTCYLNATDSSSGTGSNTTSAMTIQETVSITTPTSIAYGTVALGAESDNKTATVGNNGNVAVDMQVSSAAAMTCNAGTIPIGNTHYNSSINPYDSQCVLTNTAADTCAPLKSTFDLSKSSDGSGTPSAPTKDTYWTLKLPSTGIEGSCTGSITFTGVKST